MNDLTLEQLCDVRATLVQRIEEGLAQEDQEVACLPAYLRAPGPGLSGQALVVDAGGTNLRTAWLELRAGSPAQLLAGPLSSILPDGRTEPVDSEQFFGYQATEVEKLGAPLTLPLGYCFSYQAEVEPDGDARLIQWSKGLRVSGVEGHKVGAALRRALGQPGPIKVLNDTVAALLGGAMQAEARFTRTIGLIVGTGTNIATFFPASRIGKLKTAWEGEMAVNLESGNYHPPHLEEIDEQLDRTLEDRGRHRFEKAVSGMYLPKLLALLCPELGLRPDASAQVVVEWADRAGAERASQVSRWLLRRSADLVAASLAGVAAVLEPGPLAIQAEGGLFWNATGYADRVQSTLTRLLSPSRETAIIHVDDVNLVGAAASVLAAG